MADSTQVPMVLAEKITLLRKNLSKYTRVAVAFSGGVDSTVLLHNCSEIFKAENVIALHARSCLQSARVIEGVEKVVAKHFSQSCRYHVIECDPLDWPDFISNTSERCYFCKKRTYAFLVEESKREGCEILIDGTNTDDLKQYRPGLKAVREYGVISPFLDAGISKSDIRRYAREEGLINSDLPSNSCLATRIATDHTITTEMLKLIEDAEEFLHSLGFAGIRVRPEKNRISIEVQEVDITAIVAGQTRLLVVEYFQQKGLGPVFLGLTGR